MQEESSDEDNEGGRQVSVIFDYAQTSDFELSVSGASLSLDLVNEALADLKSLPDNAAEGETVLIIEEDDGSGWVKVANMSGAKGLVPATYLSASADAPSSASATATASAGGGGEFGVSSRLLLIVGYQILI